MKNANWILMIAIGVPLAAAAQSNVTIYGTLDAGITSISNQNGSRSTIFATGMQIPNLLGFKGSEDLGSGMKAIFKLESQFGLDDGQMIGGTGFTRQTYVGLASSVGTFTMGYQYEFMFESLSAARLAGSLPYVSLYNLQQGPFQGLGAAYGGLDFNRVAGAFRVPNSVKFVTNDFNGFNVGVLYGMDEKAGSFDTKSTVSAAINYARGPWGANAAYTYAKDASINDGKDGIRNWGVGGRYTAPTWQVDAIYTNTQNTFTNARVGVYQVGADWKITPATILRGDYQLMKGNAQVADNKAHQFGVTLDYWLSKRTDIYTNVVYQRTSGNGQTNAWIAGLPGASDGRSQTALRIGMRHFF